MTFIGDAESKIAQWLKVVPDLPKEGQKWLAENVWWLVLISVILLAISVPFTIGAILLALAISVGTYYASVVHGGGWALVTAISLLFSLVILVLEASAISPLKAHARKGWYLMFLVLLVGAVEVVVNAFVDFNAFSFIFSILFGGLWLAVGAYFLFQIRSYFVSVKAVKSSSKK